jgi:hypothetical protein
MLCVVYLYAIHFKKWFSVCYTLRIFIKPLREMEHRRIAIYLNSRQATAKVQLNHLYTQKVDLIIFKTGYSKTEVARQLLMKSFQTEDLSELKERIYYAANLDQETIKVVDISVKRRIADVCKKALKLAIDKGYLL